MAQVKSIYLKLTLTAKIMSSIIGWISSSTFLARFRESLLFMSHPLVFIVISITKDHYFNLGGKVLSLPIRLKPTYLNNSLQNHVLSSGHDDPSFGASQKVSSSTSAPCSCLGPAGVSPPAQTSISISGRKEKHVVSCHQLYIHSQADSPIHKPTVKNNTLLTLRFLIFDKVISKLK